MVGLASSGWLAGVREDGADVVAGPCGCACLDEGAHGECEDFGGALPWFFVDVDDVARFEEDVFLFASEDGGGVDGDDFGLF